MMRRILIIGSGGAGKSVLAGKLAARLNLPLVHLDRLFWKPGWVESDGADFKRRLLKVLKTKRWIIDGNFIGSLEMRLKFADTVIYLDFNRWVCLWRALKRQINIHGCRRPDMTEGCEEKIDLKFLEWVWSFSRKSRPRILEILNKRPKKTKLLVLKSTLEASEFLKEMPS
jgi:adenylate kinase family enzyme